MLLRIRLFKYLVYLNAWILKHFVLLWFILLYQKIIYIYKIVLGAGWVPARPQGVGIGQGSFPRTPPTLPHTPRRGGDGEGQQPCEAGTKIPSTDPTPPYCHPYFSIFQNIPKAKSSHSFFLLLSHT